MSAPPNLEARVSTLEKQVSLILEKMEARPHKPGWISRISGSFADCPEFDEVIRLGQEFRKEMNAVEDPA